MKHTAIFYSIISFAVLWPLSTSATPENTKLRTPETPTSPTLKSPEYIESIIVTSTREEKSKSQLPESVTALSRMDIENISPTHPSEALNRIPGVHINNLGGEGHMSSIRQPITTSGVYLFLEDGIPTRPSGFFNHNGLYEINIPQGNRIEVIKGPGSALYGSDAIGGVINIITKPSPSTPQFDINAETGSNGWRRSLISIGAPISKQTNALAEYNYTDSEGFRDAADYDRQSANFRLDSALAQKWNFKLLISKSEINQSGVSSLELEDFKNNTKKNYYHSDIGFRKVDALRLSSELTYEPSPKQLLTITSYYRNNEMKMMPSWMVTYDPNIRLYDFESYGALVKYRLNLFDNGSQAIFGFDYDTTPASYAETKITTYKNSEQEYIAYTVLDNSYNYLFDTQQRNVSPYLHSEFQVGEKWRISAGLRYDRFNVNYENFLSALDESPHIRPESQSLHYANTSPKLGAIFQYNSKHHLYLNYREAFRAPTIGALFRPGASNNSTQLKPVKSQSSEIGFRGRFNNRLQYEIALYDMTVNDDIVSIIDESTRKSVNAGKTKHQGIEIGFDKKFNNEFMIGVSYTRTNQEYESFTHVIFDRACFCNRELDFAGNDLSKAPKDLANFRIAYTPTHFKGFRAELELMKVGGYFTDQTNTQRYSGHDLANLRMHYQVTPSFLGYINIHNLGSKRYSTYTSNQVNLDPKLEAPISYRPGRPRSFFVGLRYNF